jgi:hypothetical protein
MPPVDGALSSGDSSLEEAYGADVECSGAASDDCGDFTDIGDRVEAGNISVAVTEGEIESQIEVVEAAGAAVQSAAAVFHANYGGFKQPSAPYACSRRGPGSTIVADGISVAGS